MSIPSVHSRPLGAVIQCRTFSANGELNPLTKRKHETKVKVTPEGEFQAELAEEAWDPRPMLSILDGLQSIRYLFILVQMGDEQDVHSFFDTLERKARSMPQKLPQYKLYYETASWRLAQTMRRGVAFKAAADEILGDNILWQETMAKVVRPREASQEKTVGAREAAQGRPKAAKPAEGADRVTLPRAMASSATGTRMTGASSGSSGMGEQGQPGSR